MVVLGVAPDPISVQAVPLIFGTRSIRGSLTGSSIENEDDLAFTVARDVRPTIEVMPLAEAPEAYARMMAGDARFRTVLDMGSDRAGRNARSGATARSARNHRTSPTASEL